MPHHHEAFVIATLVGLAGAPVLAAGCDKKDDAPKTPVIAASAIATAAPPAGPKTLAFVIDPASKTTIDMPAPKEHIRASTTAATGELTVDPGALGNTRGQVKVDLTSLTTRTFDDPTKDHSQTEHAHNWLEAGDLVTPAVREANRWVIFTIRSVEGLTQGDLTKAPVTRAPGLDDTRTVDATVKGDFFLHGHQVPKDVPVRVVFHYPSGRAEEASPTRVDITTTTPLHVVLAEHDVKPRDGFGKLAQASLSLISKVAETADVTLALSASPGSPAARTTPAAAPPAPSGSAAH